MKSTFFACAVAFEQNPALARAVVAAGHEICSHGWRWEEVFRLSEEEERGAISGAPSTPSVRRAASVRSAGIAATGRACGRAGWWSRRAASFTTSDAYNDDVPYFVEVEGKRHLVVPYTPDVNDIRFWLSPGFVTADQFYSYMKDSFDVLYAESARYPRMMSIGLHPRIIGRPGRLNALRRFIDHAKAFPDVWFATREEIARSRLEIA